MLFLRFEKGMSKKITPGNLRFLSMLFLIFENGMKKKHFARNFEVRQYAFWKVGKRDEQKILGQEF